MEADLEVPAPPLYIQEKVHPKALIDDLRRQTTERANEASPEMPDLFADFNGLPSLDASTEFYQHDQNWSNRMILGDSLQVMASLSEREGLRGKVQCIFMDPPYGIKFNSNFQWSTTSRDVTDGKAEHITREPEQVKAFRDTWRDGIHSYLTYLRDRLTVARDLLKESGSIFVQIGDENVHRVRAVMDEVFGAENLVSQILYRRGGFQTGKSIANTFDYILWYARSQDSIKARPVFAQTDVNDWYPNADRWIESSDGIHVTYADKDRIPPDARLHSDRACFSATGGESSSFRVNILGIKVGPPSGRGWSTNQRGVSRLLAANRLMVKGRRPRFKPYYDDFPLRRVTNGWMDTVRGGFTSGGEDSKVYVVQTGTSIIQRCILMSTDPGDLVLDPTCGSGTTAYVAEQWGRRWITIDTSRVALALARARVMGARYPYYLLSDSTDGQMKEAEVTRKTPSSASTYGDIRQGFVYERVPHITLKAIANNAEIDVIYEQFQPAVEVALAELNAALRGHEQPYRVTAGGRQGGNLRFDASKDATHTLPNGEDVPAHRLLEWEVPREAPEDWPKAAVEALGAFWDARIERQREIDASIAAKADFEYLYDKPYQDKGKVRVAGPFTVESLTPHRVVEADRPPPPPAGPANQVREERTSYEVAAPPTKPPSDFAAVILEQLRTAGIQQVEKEGKIDFTALTGWPGRRFAAEGRYQEGEHDRRAAIFIGSEHGTVGRSDLVGAAREASEADFDVLISCAFNYDAQTTDFKQLGRLPILKARMNADLQMSTDLKKTKGGNLFVIFGEPDIEVLPAADDQIQVKINGVDLFDPRSGNVRSSEPEDLACWFIDTDYDMASFFVRHAYFLGANDPYKALKTTLRTEIDPEAWASLRSAISRPFPKPNSGQIAVKAINHLGDEVMKVIDAA
ncbi:MAG: site-specific DNA-methyltransferase [Gammaproteobacteria bacterium]|nr:site-specific DNA-methyltransferase [Gammaproteobacteria bacterium]MDE0272175.1 site-specific DNA-methyltransferase [Gammaproteobacteria bacterium]